MSRCYRIEVSESLRRHLDVGDGLVIHLELLDILPPERMKGLLDAELKARGYTEEDGHLTRTTDDGVVVRIDPEGEVHISLSAEKEVELEQTRTAQAYNPDLETKRLQGKIQADLEKRASTEEAALRRDVTERLEASLDDLRKELDDAVTRATAEALKEKARQLGEVQEISENAETGEVVIRVKV